MSKKKRAKKIGVRSWIAVSSHFRRDAGPHGGTARQRNRADRRDAKKLLRDHHE